MPSCVTITHMNERRREYLRDYQKKWLRNNRLAVLEGKSCVSCGGTERLEFDHIDPKTKISHSIWSWSKERRASELAKCQILCRSCHKKKTAADMGWTVPHGSSNRYRRYGCRCDVCRRGNADRVARQRARWKAIGKKRTYLVPKDKRNGPSSRT